ncbi:hypothetical protein [Burkholderia gladioli]|uniref:hypothetical protein n=1 Tax=Burkholderia gladioli TaxID=28095 RepID=UPI003132D9D8
MQSTKRTLCRVLALAVSRLGATHAMAAPVIQGGGSSLIAPMSNDEIALFGNGIGALTYSSLDLDAGQKAFLGNQPTSWALV